MWELYWILPINKKQLSSHMYWYIKNGYCWAFQRIAESLHACFSFISMDTICLLSALKTQVPVQN